MSHVKEGYKQTKVGVIPDDWDVAQIKDVTDYVDYRGKTPKKVESGVLLVTARNIKQGYLDYDTSREYIAEDDYSNVMSRGMPKIGDVLLTTEAPLGNIAQIDNENIALAQRVIKFRAKDNFDNTYLKYHFLSERFQSYLYRLAIGTTVLGIQGKQLHKMLIPLPPLPEQQKIAKILTTWDSAISKQEELIKAKEELKKGLMQKLLSGEVRFGGFEKIKGYKKTKVGVIPDDWTKLKLSEIFSISSQKFNPISNTENKKCVELEHLSQESGNLLGFTNSNEQQSIKNCFNKGQILFGKLRPYLKKYWKAEFNGVCSSEIWVLNGKKATNNYLFYLVQTNKFNQIANVSSGSKMPRADWVYMSEIPFNLPPLKEQQKIAQVLSLADKEIELLKNELKSLKEQKKGLMQKLLTGEVRVKI